MSCYLTQIFNAFKFLKMYSVDRFNSLNIAVVIFAFLSLGDKYLLSSQENKKQFELKCFTSQRVLWYIIRPFLNRIKIFLFRR